MVAATNVFMVEVVSAFVDISKWRVHRDIAALQFTGLPIEEVTR